MASQQQAVKRVLIWRTGLSSYLTSIFLHINVSLRLPFHIFAPRKNRSGVTVAPRMPSDRSTFKHLAGFSTKFYTS